MTPSPRLRWSAIRLSPYRCPLTPAPPWALARHWSESPLAVAPPTMTPSQSMTSPRIRAGSSQETSEHLLNSKCNLASFSLINHSYTLTIPLCLIINLWLMQARHTINHSQHIFPLLDHHSCRNQICHIFLEDMSSCFVSITCSLTVNQRNSDSQINV